MRRLASLEGRRPGCIRAVHPSRLGMRCIRIACLTPQDDGSQVCAVDLQKKMPGTSPGIRILNSQKLYAPTIGMRGYSPGVPAGVIGMPPSEYSLSLLRSVRIEIPKMLAAWVR